MDVAKKLDSAIDEAIGEELDKAYDLMIKKQFSDAEPHMKRSWDLFPEPKYQWENSESTIRYLSEFYMEWEKYDEAMFWAKEIFKCNPLPGNGYPYFLLGKIHYELREFELARRQFEKAYELAGRREFQNEDQKYFKFLKEKK